MVIPSFTKQQFDSVIRQFDYKRNSPDQLGWENLPGNEFVLLYNSKIYPAKYILSNATKIPETDLDDSEVLTYFTKKGDWKVQIQPIEKYLNPVNPVILEVADFELFNYRLLERRMELFESGPHKSFNSDFYWEDERKYKKEAVKLHQDTLSQKKLLALIEQKEFKEGATIIKRNYQKDNLLYKPWEIQPFQNVSDENLVQGLYNLQYGEEKFATRLDNWIKLLAKEKPLCWPAATYHLMLQNPNEHIFVKPGTIGKLLGAVGSKLQWQPHTNVAFYFQIQRFCRAILPELKPLGAKDMLDVQSFSWVTRNY
jgi:hypothetical protein